MYRIYIAEDDETIASALKKGLTGWGYEVRCTENFRAVAEEAAAFSPQIVLMDISLPFCNGFHWCEEIRKTSNVPIVFISSASDNMNIVTAMTMGGDDFIAKPFDLGVLNAKLRAVLRRAYDLPQKPQIIYCGGAALNISDASLVYNGQNIELTKNEYKILETLMRNKGRIVSRDELMNRLWQTDSFVDENTLTVNVARLRKKLDGAGLADFIKTKVGMGYEVE